MGPSSTATRRWIRNPTDADISSTPRTVFDAMGAYRRPWGEPAPKPVVARKCPMAELGRSGRNPSESPATRHGHRASAPLRQTDAAC